MVCMLSVLSVVQCLVTALSWLLPYSFRLISATTLSWLVIYFFRSNYVPALSWLLTYSFRLISVSITQGFTLPNIIFHNISL